MAKFLADNALNAEIENVFLNAKEQIIIVSPYIKLHDRYMSALNQHKNNLALNIILIFGKNEDDVSKSMKQDDFNFFKEFPNIEIRHEERLHAKYYANELTSILTSMNLYSYSQDTNIEFGVMVKKSLMSSDKLDRDAWEYFRRVYENSNLLFDRFSESETKFGIFEKFNEPKTVVDKLSEFFANKSNNKKYEVKKVARNTTKSTKTKHVGFCIRTGVEIPFNVDKPMCYDAYKSWNKYGDADYPEKFCHFTGEPSNGKTSVSKPILNKNWNQAKKYKK